MHSRFVFCPKLYVLLLRIRTKKNYEKILYLKTIKRSETIFDLGANVGYYTTLFSLLVGDSGKVHAFEPLMENFRKLENNTIRFYANLIINQTGIDTKDSTKRIFFDHNELEKASIHEPVDQKKHSHEIQVTSVDNYVRKNKINKVDFIKCDIEGHEMKALMGMKETLQNFHPKLSIEVTLPNDERVDLVHLLRKLGYDNFQQIEKGYPQLDLAQLEEEEYFYLYASSTKCS
jgi:FkbM family methyltransferase